MQELEDKYRNKDIVDTLVLDKTNTGMYMDHPEFPGDEA